MEKFGVFCLFTFASVTAAIYSAIVFIELWDWFVIPIFSLPELGIVPVMGLLVFSNFVFNRARYKKDTIDFSDGEEIIARCLFMFIYPTITYVVGYLISLFL